MLFEPIGGSLRQGARAGGRQLVMHLSIITVALGTEGYIVRAGKESQSQRPGWVAWAVILDNCSAIAIFGSFNGSHSSPYVSLRITAPACLQSVSVPSQRCSI